MLGDKRFLRTIKLRNMLSFGPQTTELELQSLNVLIGPNGSGKSNLIETISLLQAAPRDLLAPIRSGGGIREWLWKGADDSPGAELDVTVSYPEGKMPLRHWLEFGMVGQRAELIDESIDDECSVDQAYYDYNNSSPIFGFRVPRPVGLLTDQSILSQRKGPQYPEITFLGDEYSRIRIYQDWDLGRNSQPRRPQPTDLPTDFLQEDAANIALVLHDLAHQSLRTLLVEKLRNADESITDFSTSVFAGTIQLFLHYSGLKSPVPATRLSDGTFRYLCLLAVLCHPSPPPLVCLEEPESGLHPDLLPGLADLLIEASHRMQLVVTTHSDVLVDGLTKVPEAVIVCEKAAGATTMTRHSAADLAEWLKEYGLGQIWRKGEIGGNRW